MTPLLSVSNLKVSFGGGPNAVRAVRGVDLELRSGQILALVGESGCGKSLTALSIMGLFPPTARAEGSIVYNGTELLSGAKNAVRAVRGKEIAMVFQEPMTSLNPSFTVGEQIAEMLRRHQGLKRDAASAKAVELLDRVRIAAPKQRAKAYPHQLSGGMRQRVMIAIAISCEPKLLILDEPTTALDVTTQAQVLEIVRGLRDDMDIGVLLITHDLGVVADLADDVHVMYAGATIEQASVAEIFRSPTHPYTAGLMAAIPRRTDGIRQRLSEIEGTVPVVRSAPSGCVFADRCPYREGDCQRGEPQMISLSLDHQVACRHPRIAEPRGVS